MKFSREKKNENRRGTFYHFHTERSLKRIIILLVTTYEAVLLLFFFVADSPRSLQRWENTARWARDDP